MNAPALTIEGIVASGLGDGAYFTRLDWAARQFADKLGFEPYAGTFNLRVTGRAWTQAQHALSLACGIPIVPPPGYCGARCFPVLVQERVAGAAVLPDVPGYPQDKLEILAPVSVRAALGLVDGDRVSVRIEIGERRARQCIYQQEES